MDNVRHAIGQAGEEVVKHYFPFAVSTEDWYDDKKDGKIGSYTYEVKVCTYNDRMKGFLIDENQFNKLDKVNFTFFISVPHENFAYFSPQLKCQLLMHITGYDEVHKEIKLYDKRKRVYLVDRLVPIAVLKDEASTFFIKHCRKLQNTG